jgi:hypothetical protein
MLSVANNPIMLNVINAECHYAECRGAPPILFILAGKLIFFWKFPFVEPVQWQKIFKA